MSGSMQKTLLLWLAGGAGVVLLYAAVKNKHPRDIMNNVMGNGFFTAPNSPAVSNYVPPLPGLNQPTVIDSNGYSVGVPPIYGNGATYIPPASRIA